MGEIFESGAMDGSSDAVSTDVCMLEHCPGKGARSEDELDQLQWSKKKSKTAVEESDRNSVDVVLKKSTWVFSHFM